MSQWSPDDSSAAGEDSTWEAVGEQSGVPEMPVILPEIRIELDKSDRTQRDDDRFLIRFYAICVLMIGLVTIVPALYQWIQISQADGLGVVPRWAYLLGFVGGLHLLYAILLFQVDDYSAIQSLAVFLLVVTCMYGFLAVTLTLGGAAGSMARLLEVPSVLRPRASIWCGLMFGISALSCFLLGREAVILRRRQSGVRV